MDTGKLFSTQATLTSPKLVLRKITPQDLDAVFGLYSNEIIFEYCGILTHKNRDTVLKMIGHFERDFNQQTRIKWGIASAQDPDQLLGILALDGFNKNLGQVTLGYFLHPEAWNRGYASEAVRLMTQYLFEQIGVNRIQAEVMPGNRYSKKVLLKNGYLLEGTLRQSALWVGKGLVDLEIYAILASDYRP